MEIRGNPPNYSLKEHPGQHYDRIIFYLEAAGRQADNADPHIYELLFSQYIPGGRSETFSPIG